MSSHPTEGVSGITCSTRPHAAGSSTWIALTGEIDAALRDQASEAMVFLVAADDPVVIDAGTLTFIDSSGLAFLVQIYKVCQESSLDVVLLDPPDNLLDLLEMLGMADRFTIEHADVEQSLPAGA